jgi:hypothetical protein
VRKEHPLLLTAAAEVADPATPDAMFAQAVTFGCEGLVCTSAEPDSVYQEAEAAELTMIIRWCTRVMW